MRLPASIPMSRHVSRPTFASSASNSTLLDISKTPEYASLSEYQKFSAQVAFQLLLLANQFGYLSRDEIKSVCDFGAGSGGATFGLKKFANASNTDCIALETSAGMAQAITNSRILPPDSVKVGDGLQYLTEGHTPFDLITASMFGPDGSESFAECFLEAARNSLKQNGKLLIYSDPHTMQTVKNVLEKKGIYYDWIGGIPADPPIPSTAIVSFDKPGKPTISQSLSSPAAQSFRYIKFFPGTLSPKGTVPEESADLAELIRACKRIKL